MLFLTQSRYPGLWRIFQYLIGGTVDKRQLCLRHYRNEKNVLEVGCSIGNISSAFLAFPEISFTGVDIDPVVIEYAQKQFSRYSNFDFFCQDLVSFSRETKKKYDFILFAGIFHHIESQECGRLLNAAQKLLAENGKIVIVDPLIPDPDDPWFVHTFLKLEQGSHLRTGRKMEEILETVIESSHPPLQTASREECLIGATPFHWPVCARFGVYTLNLLKETSQNILQ